MPRRNIKPTQLSSVGSSIFDTAKSLAKIGVGLLALSVAGALTTRLWSWAIEPPVPSGKQSTSSDDEDESAAVRPRVVTRITTEGKDDHEGDPAYGQSQSAVICPERPDRPTTFLPATSAPGSTTSASGTENGTEKVSDLSFPRVESLRSAHCPCVWSGSSDTAPIPYYTSLHTVQGAESKSRGSQADETTDNAEDDEDDLSKAFQMSIQQPDASTSADTDPYAPVPWIQSPPAPPSIPSTNDDTYRRGKAASVVALPKSALRRSGPRFAGYSASSIVKPQILTGGKSREESTLGSRYPDARREEYGTNYVTGFTFASSLPEPKHTRGIAFDIPSDNEEEPEPSYSGDHLDVRDLEDESSLYLPRREHRKGLNLREDSTPALREANKSKGISSFSHRFCFGKNKRSRL